MNKLEISKHLGVRHNVSFRVIDEFTGKVIQEHIGHNEATNSMLLGIGHYLVGDGVLNQGNAILSAYIPKYISLGTMGLRNQDVDEAGLPAGVGEEDDSSSEELQFENYKAHVPGYGADGYDSNQNNGRLYMGLGPVFNHRADDPDTHITPDYAPVIGCELISETFPRSAITYKEIVPEFEAERARTIDVVLSAMVSTGALRQFRSGVDHVFITEAGLWSAKQWSDSGENGLLAAYRIMPPNEENWDMSIQENRDILKQNILCVRKNQVVQVIWKIQLGSIGQLT